MQLNSNNESWSVIYFVLGLLVLWFWIGWFLMTKHIRDELRDLRKDLRHWRKIDAAKSTLDVLPPRDASDR